MSVELNLTAKEIYEKEFKKSRVKGYSEEDVNDYLDLIIEDYMKLDKLLTRLKELEIENQNLKIKIDALKNANRDERPVQVTNLDILKRLSKLETAVFGPNGVDYDV
ncbi:DivIVA domain-containing protein [Gemella sp.]